MEPIAPVRSTAATRGLPFGEDGLTAGQVVRARVVGVEGDVVRLRWGEQTVSVASRVPLSVGQQVDLLVEEGAAGKMLLRMVDDAIGKGRPPRPDGPPSSGRGTDGQAATTVGRFTPVVGLPGGQQDADASTANQSFAGGAPDWPGASGPGSLAARPAGGRPRLADIDLHLGRPAPMADQHAAALQLARAALPAYGRIAQSVGGADVARQLLTTLGQATGRRLDRAPLAPGDLGRLLVEIGAHPDETNAVLVSALLGQRVGVTEAGVRALRRELAAAGGTLADAAPAALLSRLGLPITPLSLAIARQTLAGQLDLPGAWKTVLGQLQQLARAGHDQAGARARELLWSWRVPLEGGAGEVGRWLRQVVDQTATPLEAKLARPLAGPPAGESEGAALVHDVRVRLQQVGQALAASQRAGAAEARPAIQRLDAAVQAEQVLNGASGERSEPRFFAVTLPAVAGHHASPIELRVRERDARPGAPGEAGRSDMVHLKLSLAGLGDLGVSLLVGQRSVGCHFSTATPFAEALISTSCDELLGRLKRLGYPHVTVDAAHEPIVAPPPAPPAVPRLHHVDLRA